MKILIESVKNVNFFSFISEAVGNMTESPDYRLIY
jgi:hypothetical protein